MIEVEVRSYDNAFRASRKINSRSMMFRLIAMIIPRKRPGMEKLMLYKEMTSTRYSFLKPRARSMPYS